MVRHFLVAALRSMAANPLQTAIAIFGLSVGLAAAILAGIIALNQMRFDSFIPGSERVYLVALEFSMGGSAAYTESSSPDLAADLRQNFRQVQASTRMVGGHNRTLLRRGDIQAREDFNWADPNFFQLLPMPVLYGDLNSALARPDGIVIPVSIARKYFGRDNVVGQNLAMGRERHPMTVTAVIADLPVNASNFNSGIFASSRANFSSVYRADQRPGMGADGDRVSFNTQALVRLTPGTDVAALERAITERMNRLMRLPRPNMPSIPVHLLRRDQLHLSPGLSPGVGARLAIQTAAALLVLFLACVNFINLATARAVRRGTEVGIRKVAGASRQALMIQFLGEAVLQVLFALCVAVMLVELSLPAVNAFLNSGAVFDYWRDPGLALALLLGALLVGLLAGVWPALVLSGLRPATVLKGVMAGGSGLLRPLLVGVQFVILLVLIVAAITVLQQHRYASRDALRLNTDQMLFVRYDKCDGGTFQTGVHALPGVAGTACSSVALLPELVQVSTYQRHGGGEVHLHLTSTGFGMLELYGLKPVAGRLFSRGHGDAVPAKSTPATLARFVLNETAVRQLGFASPHAAVGQIIRNPPPRPGGTGMNFGVGEPQPAGAEPLGNDINQGVIIGVVRDFSLYPRETVVKPTAYSVGWTSRGTPTSELLHVKLRGRDIPETLAAMDALWAKTGDGTPIVRNFVDSYVQDMVIAIQRQGQAFGVLAGIAVLLACLGLFGLSISAAERRTKEIGIRKAMGASSRDIVILLLWQFIRPVLVAILIAWPLGWWLMQHWLSGFPYHIALGPWPFLAAAGLALAVAILTVSAHAVITARAVPATALRYE